MELEIRTDLPAKIKRERKRAVVSELNEVGLSPDGAAAEPVKTEVVEKTSVGEIEAEVLRIPPNPRLVICRYWAGGEERRCMVRVGRNFNFVPRMKFWLPEPSDPAAWCKPWPYTGPLPRRRGRW
jgi:hypothetical protein